MRVDSYGCVVMEKDGMPGDLGDSCAETGRYVVLLGMKYMAKLEPFVLPTGFVRHPDAPADAGPPNHENWREPDFTSDQMIYLLMAAYLTDRPLFDRIVQNLGLMTKFKGPDVWLIAFQWFNLMGVTTLVQVLINKFPWRWADGGEADGHWYSKFWRFVRNDTMTVSYLTVYISMLFLARVGVTWPQRFFDQKLYLAKAKAYYADQPHSTWFTDMFDTASSTLGLRP